MRSHNRRQDSATLHRVLLPHAPSSAAQAPSRTRHWATSLGAATCSWKRWAWTRSACASGSTCSTKWRTTRPTAGTRRSSAAMAGLSVWGWRTARHTTSGWAPPDAPGWAAECAARCREASFAGPCGSGPCIPWRSVGLGQVTWDHLRLQLCWEAHAASCRQGLALQEWCGTLHGRDPCSLGRSRLRCCCAGRRTRPRASRTSQRGETYDKPRMEDVVVVTPNKALIGRTFARWPPYILIAPA